MSPLVLEKNPKGHRRRALVLQDKRSRSSFRSPHREENRVAGLLQTTRERHL